MKDLGVLSSAIGHSFEMAPPLITSRADLDEVVRTAKRAVTEIGSG
jgi:adenosylmethionine-8-amino-7-oxononanoate aminotransferase